MQSIQTVSENTIYVGASDRRLAKFENLFPIPRGVSYNAYVILDEKTIKNPAYLNLYNELTRSLDNQQTIA